MDRRSSTNGETKATFSRLHQTVQIEQISIDFNPFLESLRRDWVFLKLRRIFNHDPNIQHSFCQTYLRHWQISKKINKLHSSINNFSVQKYQLSYSISSNTRSIEHNEESINCETSSWKFHTPRKYLSCKNNLSQFSRN